MSVALPLDTGDRLWPEAADHGVVAVFVYGFADYSAACSCGWTGRRRYLRAGAQLDAWQHSALDRCDVSVPLVMPGSRRRA